MKHQPVRVITCPTKKYIVIHPSRYLQHTPPPLLLPSHALPGLSPRLLCVCCRLNKGRALLHVLREYGGHGPAAEVVGGGGGGGEGGMEQEALDVEFVLVVGDERTDEDMFDVLQGRYEEIHTH